MNSSALVIALRIIHIVSGIFWVGGAMVVAWFVLPSVRALGPAGGPVMNQLAQVRKLPLRLLTAGWVTVLAGLALYARAGSLNSSAWYTTRAGLTFGIGGVLGLGVVLMGTFGNLPTARRMGVVAAQLQASPGQPAPELAAEMQRLQLRLKRLAETAAILLLIAAIAMAIARFV